MKDKLEVGMYVKFKTLSNQVKVGQIQLIDNSIYELDNNEVTADKYIVKASYNIIEILENWDFVSTITGECALIIGVYHDINGKKYIRLCNCIGDYYEDDIKSIITHEQIEQMEYKVGD